MRSREQRQNLVASRACAGWMLPGKEAQSLARPDLKQEAIRLFQQLAYAVGKTHRLAHMLRPVGGVRGLLFGNPCPGDIGKVWNTWSLEFNVLSQFRYFLHQWLEHARMDGVRGLDATAGNIVSQ